MMMTQVMTSSLAQTFNWKGKGAKNGLVSSKLARAILGMYEYEYTIYINVKYTEAVLMNCNCHEFYQIITDITCMSNVF